jgi:hypothetical protein
MLDPGGFDRGNSAIHNRVGIVAEWQDFYANGDDSWHLNFSL